MKALALVIAAGCYHDKPVAKPVASPIAGLSISESSVGPITRNSTATLQALRIALGPDYAVTPKNVNNTLRYNVSRGGEPILDVKTDDEGNVESVAVTSVRVPVAGRSWQVGAPFKDPSPLTACECDDDPERTICYKMGEHIAVAFNRSCKNLDDVREHSTGATIDRVVWSAKPWGDEPAGEGEADGGPPPNDD